MILQQLCSIIHFFTVISKLSSNVSETGNSWRDLVCIETHLNDSNPPWGRHNFEISSKNEVNIDLLSMCRIASSFFCVKILYLIWGCTFTYNEALYSVYLVNHAGVELRRAAWRKKRLLIELSHSPRQSLWSYVKLILKNKVGFYVYQCSKLSYTCLKAQKFHIIMLGWIC